jgi:hypothetical protein
MDSDVFRAVIAPVTVSLGTAVVTAAAGGMAIWIKRFAQDRDKEYRKSKVLDRSIQTMSFFDQWLESHSKVASPDEHQKAKEEANHHLDRIYAAVEYVYLRDTAAWPGTGEEEEDDSPFDEIDDWLKAGLLLYRPITRIGWIARAAFYTYLCLFIILAVTLSGEVAKDTHHLLIAIPTYLFFLIPALFIRWWAVSDETRAKNQRKPGLRRVATRRAGSLDAFHTRDWRAEPAESSKTG